MQINKEHETEVIKTDLKKNQKDWIEHFNQKGQKMISAPDIYQTAKKEDKTLMESLKQDFKDSWVVTSTRIIYNKEDLNAEIIHDFDSKIVKEKRFNVKINEYREIIKEDSETEAYLQALFDTKDDINTIIKVIKRFDNQKNIYLLTPSQSSRADRPIRSVRLYFYFDGFYVDGGSWIGNYGGGLSRGVLVSSAKQNTKKKGGNKP